MIAILGVLLALVGVADATPVTLVLGEWQRVTLSATPGTLTQVNVPHQSRRVWTQFVGSPGRITHTGSDGGALGDHYGSFAGDSWIDARYQCAGHGSQDVGRDGCVIYVASTGVSTVVEFYATSAGS